MTVEALESRTLLTVPAGLIEERIATGLAQPVAMAFARPLTTAVLAVRNDGNTAYAGPVALTLMASSDATADASDVVLSSRPMTLKVKAGGSRRILPRGVITALPPGSYHVVGRVEPTGTPAGANPANNTAVGATFLRP